MSLAADPSETVGAGIEVVANSLTLIVSDSEVGVWPLNRIEIGVEEDGFHVQVDGEEFVFVTRDAEEFARAVGVLDRPVNGHRHPVPVAKAPKVKATKPARPSKPAKRARSVQPARVMAPKPRTQVKGRSRVNFPDIDFASRQVQLAIAGLVLAAVLAVFAAPILAFLILGAGSVGLLVGTGSLIDPIMATRLPAELPPPRMILVSTLLVLVGMTILTFI